MSESALIVEVPEAEAAIGYLRDELDETAALGVPAHVTILYPFVAPDELDERTLDALRVLAARTPAFRYHLGETGRFEDALWLRPSPDDAFRALTEAVWRHFPDRPPYGGAHPDIRPHLTVASRADVLADEARSRAVETAMAKHLPFACEARALSVFVPVDDGRYARRATLPFASDTFRGEPPCRP